MIRSLKAGFKTFQGEPACFSLTADALYSNAFSYLTVLSRHVAVKTTGRKQNRK